MVLRDRNISAAMSGNVGGGVAGQQGGDGVLGARLAEFPQQSGGGLRVVEAGVGDGLADQGMGFESVAIPGLLQFPQQHMPGARTDLGAELACQGAGGDTNNPHAP
jgi:hypothetical protein